MKNLFITFLVSTILLSSCVTNFKSNAVYQPERYVNTINIKPITKIIVDSTKKVTGVAQTTILLGIIPLKSPNSFVEPTQGSSINGILGSCKKAAVFNAIGQTKYNTIVVPRYTIRIKNGLFIDRYTVQVEGWGGIEVPINVKN